MRWLNVIVLGSLALVHFIVTNAQSVGRTAGQFAVSPTGAATYTIPIWVPPGPRGMQPSIALVYNSQAGNGLLGVGWNLAGLSSISRCNLTYAQDGAPAPVSLVTTDGYCLDGQRLRLTSGTYGADGSTYQTEVANFENVTAHGMAGNGPASFTVQTPDGHTLQYGTGGSSSNAQVVPTGSSTALSWLLNTVTDATGNTMTISYLAGGGAPSTISWTPTSYGATSYVYTMVFGYGANELPLISYVAGFEIQNPNLLGTITINYNGAQVKQYVLSYQLSSASSRDTLTEIQECATSTSNCLSPTTISYQAGVSGTSTTANVAVSSPLSTCFTTCGGLAHYDFNGDGYTDLYYCTSSGCYVAFGTAGGFGSPVSAPSNALMGDLLGTGQPGLFANNGGTWYYYSWNGSSFVGQSTGLAYDSTAAQFALVDINGDGRPDLEAFYSSSGTTVTTRLNTSSGTAPSFSATAVTALSDPSWTFNGAITPDSQGGSAKTFDFNGDGLPDVALREYQCVAYSGGTCSQYATTISALIAQPGGTLSKLPIFGVASLATGQVIFANVNNDACTDVIYGTSVYVSACNGVAGSAIGTVGTVVGVMDWNGDGLADLIEDLGGTLYVQTSTASGFASLINTTIPYNVNCNYIGFDANGDGLDDLGCASSASGTNGFSYYLHNGAGTPPDLAATISDGFGNSASPSYTSIVQGDYSAAAGTYPDLAYFQPIYVTQSVTYSDPSKAAGNTYSQTFHYYDSYVNVQGRGWDGFYEYSTTDSRTGLTEYQTRAILFPYTGMQFSDTLYSGGQEVAQSVATPAATLLSSGSYPVRYFPYQSNVTSQRWELFGPENGDSSITQSTSYTYDNYGNATTIASTVTDTDPHSPYLGDTWQTTTTTVPQVNTSTWCLNLLTQSTVVYQASVGNTVTRMKGFTPDTTHCRYTQVVTEPSPSVYSPTYTVTETLGYDTTFGNLISDSMTGNGMATRTTNYTWNGTGQFPQTVTNALSQSTQLAFDPVWGKRTSLTDPNAIQTQWSYDPAFGRLNQITRPDGTYTKFTYSDCATSGGCLTGSHGIVRARTVFNSDNSTMTDSNAFYDSIDRPLVTTQRMLISGSYSRNEVRYDSLGNTVWQATPCIWSTLTTACTTGTALTYDALNRETKSQLGSLAPTTYAYSGRSVVTTDPNGHANTTITDINGWLRETLDANGYAVTTSYDAAGSKTGVADNQGRNLWSGTVEYGIAAFTTIVTDSALGSQTYTFDALGEQTCWTTARYTSPCAFSATYDALSRPVTRTEPDFFTQWTWGISASSDNIGKLASVCTGASATVGAIPSACTANSTTVVGEADGYSYDIAGRLEQQTIALPNYGSFTYNLQYNTGGQVSTLTYPATVGSSALALQYSYNNGILQSILDVNDATTVWTANTTNAAGETTEETLGNGVQINRTFDPTALSLLKVTAGPGGGTTLQNQSFLYDPLGNVIERADGNLTTTENFYYDQLNRLNYSQLTGPGFPTATNLQMCYDNSGGTCTANLSGPGNVTSKTQDAQLPVSYNATWSSYNYPLSIGNGTESVSFSYGPSRMRWQQNYNNGAEVTNYIGGLLEQVVTSSGTSYRHYVFAGAEHVAVVNRTSSGDTVTYMLSDEQGSLTALLNSVGGTDVSESFTAYGARRNPASWNGAPLNSDLTTIAGLTRQGYTFQSALGQYMGLNHMNGRVEDAITGRFMSPDPYITDPTNTQDYDRYSYVYNSPLTLIDPSGFSVPCVWLTDPVTGNLLGGGCLGPSFNMGGGQTNNIISSITPLTAADLQQIFAPQLKLALDELANYKPQTDPNKCPKPATPRSTGDKITDAIVGFGDAFLIPILVRDALGIGDGTVDTNSSAYTGGEIAGTIEGLIPFALEGAASYSAAQAARGTPSILNANPFFRIGPGRWGGNMIPRVSSPYLPGSGHVSLTTRLPPLPPLGALASGNGC